MLETLIFDYTIYAPLQIQNTLDYQLLSSEDIPHIIYNTPKPVSPLKIFFLPIKENVVRQPPAFRPGIIIGCPACDLQAIDILDKIYLNEPFTDTYYKQRRENTILIGTDCHSQLPHCHCTTYGITPCPDKHADILLSAIDDELILVPKTEKGIQLTEQLKELSSPSEEILSRLRITRNTIEKELNKQNKELPNYPETGQLIKNSDNHIWKKYARTCVSCGACATICPTCTCFLLVDRPGFEKVRQMDACQLPGFARIAAGEDQLGNRSVRFKNRYLCKYVWKSENLNSIACTGCGRCIETCIGNINKNELFMEIKGNEMK